MESRMNVLMLNGSPRTNGNIALAFQEMEQVFRENGIGETALHSKPFQRFGFPSLPTDSGDLRLSAGEAWRTANPLGRQLSA